jgi:inner membrane protein
MSDTTLEAVPEAPPDTPMAIGAAMRLVAIAGILAALVIPQWLIAGLIEEREDRRESVRQEIARSWGGPQNIQPPVIVVPWRAPVSREPGGPTIWQRGSIAVLPQALNADVAIAPETRRRGLFEAIVYGATARMAGSFQIPDIVVPDTPDAVLLWREAHVLAGSTELRPAGTTAALSIDGRALDTADLDPDPSLCAPGGSLRWPLGLERAMEPGRVVRFDLAMELRGSGGLGIVPAARRATIAVRGAWATPSFAGAELPDRSRVEETGFEAEWLGGVRGTLVRRSLTGCLHEHQGAVGVELLEAVPTYRMVNRAAKYTFFFLVLTFVTCALFELTARIRMHPLQYALLGASVVLFPLLLLAIGEPLGFAAAYAISATAVAAQASLYTGVATERAALGVVLAIVLGALFAFLHVVLSLEAYALLVGTVALFLALTVVMAVTRKVRWGAA